MAILEYIWLDGYAHNPEHSNDVANIRSKIKVTDKSISCLGDIPNWSFDGSSTRQAEGHKSDCVLKPVFYCINPLKVMNRQVCLFPDSHIVLCEVFNADGSPHASNSRHKLVKSWEKYKHNKMWFALEQEYAIYDQYGEKPYGWPDKGFPAPQGRYYCGVGADVAWGREISDEHLEACLFAGLPISGTNAEVMPSQWEYQIGPAEAPAIADQHWISRFLLNRIAEKYNGTIKLSPKPVRGDWNGTGCHINFSTKEMRNRLTMEDVHTICIALETNKKNHLDVYGKGNRDRLTGKHETCSIDQFRYGESDRGASIRIPPGILQAGKGYLEDRRPAANIDPYEACEAILSTVCSVHDEIYYPKTKSI